MNVSRTYLNVVFASAFVIHCGGSQPAGATPESAAAQPHWIAEPGEQQASGSSAEPGAADVPWKDKTREQRLEYMGLVVYPKMKETFQAQDADGFKDFKCQTCHGEDMEAVEFKMPNSLYALPVADPMGSAMEYDEAVATFMAQTVVPAMAELLGEQPYNPETQTGFGCFSCHQQEE
jgi:hypothetical protein